MREILFKAKLKDWKTKPNKNKWVEGFYLKREETTYCIKEDYERLPVKTLHYIAQDTMTDWGLPNKFRLYEIDPETLCEFSGLHDKNNNKIWENDIYADREEGITYLIEFDTEWATFVITEYGVKGCLMEYGYDETAGGFGELESNEIGYYHSPCEWFCVIGNKFDNPELLKGE